MLMKLDEKDNVAVILSDGKIGDKEKCGKEEIGLLNDIPFGHKCALNDIKKGDLIIKYGYPIGYATSDIAKGGIVREFNMEGMRGRGDLNR